MPFPLHGVCPVSVAVLFPVHPEYHSKVKNFFKPINCIQWNPSNTDTLGTTIILLISKVSLFQGENNMYLYKVGTWPGVPIKQGVLISEVSLKRGSTI